MVTALTRRRRIGLAILLLLIALALFAFAAVEMTNWLDGFDGFMNN